MFWLFKCFFKINYKFLCYILLILFIIILLLILILIIKYIILYNFYIKKNICIKSSSIWYKNLIKLNTNNKFLLYKYKNNIFNFIYYNIGIPPVCFKKLWLITNNNELIKSLINDIKFSKKNIYIIFYIWEPGYLSNKIILELINASKRGVKCKIILDAIGSINFFNTNLSSLMTKQGIQIVKYLKFNLNNIIFERFDVRQHKKIVLIDNKIIYTGSMNLIDNSYFNKRSTLGIWIDLMIKIRSKLLGNIINIIFCYDWELQTGINILRKKIKFNNFNKTLNYNKCINWVQVITSGNGLPKNIIHRFLLNLIFSSKYRIIITTPYFIPSDYIIDAICTVSSKGIDVSIIIPEKNDNFITYWSSRFFFYDLITSGVKIYSFKGNFLHTKLILIDYNISILGTINFDFRSIWLNHEIALLIKSFFLNRKLFNILKKYMNFSELINLKIIKSKNFYERFLEKFFILFNPLL